MERARPALYSENKSSNARSLASYASRSLVMLVPPARGAGDASGLQADGDTPGVAAATVPALSPVLDLAGDAALAVVHGLDTVDGLDWYSHGSLPCGGCILIVRAP